jgi:predicted porin
LESVLKKTLVAAAVLCLVTAASAQSSVTLFGVVDTNFQRISNSGGGSVSHLGNSGNVAASRVGFRGREDLGGGMWAGFWLEAGINTDDGGGVATNTNNQPSGTSGSGGLTFNRRSTLSLGGSWGEVRLGRDLSPQYLILTNYDVFAGDGVGTSLTNKVFITGSTAVRVSNAIQYWTPVVAGFQGQIAHYRGENPSTAVNADEGTGTGARVTYANGPFTAAIAFGRTDGPPGIKYKQDNVGASYNFGTVTVMGQLSRNEAGAASTKGYALGANVSVGSGVFRASLSQVTTDNGPGVDPRSRKLAVGYVHNLSKRTAIYTALAKVSNSNGSRQPAANSPAGSPAANGASRGFDLGISHVF